MVYLIHNEPMPRLYSWRYLLVIFLTLIGLIVIVKKVKPITAETTYDRLLLGMPAVDQQITNLGKRLNELETSNYSAWYAPCSIKILPSYQTPAAVFDVSKEWVLGLAANETRCFQIALSGKAATQIPTVQITTSDSSLTAEAYLQALVNITEPSYSLQDGVRHEYSFYTGALPDPLIPWSFLPYTGDDPDGDGVSPSLTNLKNLRNKHNGLAINQTRALLIEVTAGKNAPAGPQFLQLTFGNKTLSLPIRIYNFTLPDRPSLKTALGTQAFKYTLNIGKPLTMHGISDTATMKTLIDDYYHEALASFRLASYTPAWTVTLTESAYTPSTNKSEYNCTTNNFQLRSSVEALLAKFLNPGQLGKGYLKNKPIPPASNFEIQHLTSTDYNTVTPLTLCGVSPDDNTDTKSPGIPNWYWSFSRFYKAVYRYLSTKNWQDLAQINIDEPYITYVKDTGVGDYTFISRPLPLNEQSLGIQRVWKVSKAILENTPLLVGPDDSVKMFQLLTDDLLSISQNGNQPLPGSYAFNNPVVINDLNQEGINRNWIDSQGYSFAPDNCDPFAPLYQKRCFRESDQPWFYYVFDPIFQGDTTAFDHLMPGWVAYKYGFKGFLFWTINWWAGANSNDRTFINPWLNPKTFPLAGFTSQNLATLLWYPPCGDIKCPTPTYYVINSLRLPLLRESVEDYEYLKILEARAGRQQALTVSQLTDDTWMRRTTIWNSDASSLEARRRAIVSAITGDDLSGLPPQPPTPLPTASPTKTPTPTIVSNFRCNNLNATLIGTEGIDTLNGTSGKDVIVSLGGADKIYGNSGDDVICGGAGNDLIYGQGGKDTVFGEAGKDKLYGGNDDDLLYGGDNDDFFDGGAGNDLCSGEAGINTFQNCETQN